MKDIRYAIFDMDGTLVDSMGYWLGLIDEVLTLLPPTVSLSEEARAKIQTMGLRRARKYLESLNVVDDGTFSEEKTVELMRKHYETDVAVRDGVRELLGMLKASGVRMVIATLTPRSLVELCLERNGLSEYFEALYTADEYPEGKREPRIFLDIMEHFGVSAEEIWLFEDSLYSARTAKALGMRIAVTEDETQRENFPALYALADAYYTDGFTKRKK